MKKTDIVIIGSGMAGISAAIYLRRFNANFIILEGSIVGGLLNELKTVENFPTIRKASGSDILISLMDQLRANDIPVTYGNVQTILKEGNGFEVVTDVDSYECKAVIVATGIGKASATIKGEQEYAGMGVSYCATCDGNFYKGLDVAVVGNNNICLEESLYLANLVNKLYLICPDEELIGDLELIKKVQESRKIEIVKNTKVGEIFGDDFGVTGIKINDKQIDVAGVFPYVGKKTPTQILNNLKPEMQGNFVVVNEEGKTNIEGLFAAGDVTNSKLKQLITAAGGGAAAATSALNLIKTIE